MPAVTPNITFHDVETFSPTPINHGTHKYSEESEILLWTWATGEGDVREWDLTSGARMPNELEDMLEDQRVETVWHNGGNFDSVILKHAGIVLPTERIFDTMVCALAHSLPGALGILCDVLQVPLDKAKDKAGKSLIQLFCKPRPKNSKLRRATRDTHPAEWQHFVEYGRLDIIAMREVYRKLPVWNYRGKERALWELDQKINHRGVLVDVELAKAAIRASDRAQAALADETQDLTDGEVEATTQRDKLLKHILEYHGVEIPNLRASTLVAILDADDKGRGMALPPVVRELLINRISASMTSAAKYKRLLEAVSRDGRLRGLLQFCGAMRTGRWAGRIFQPQNMPRPTLEQDAIDFAIECMKADCEDLVFDNVMEVVTNAIRGVIIVPQGKKLVVSDLSNIEGRMLVWHSGEEWKLQAFRDFDAGTGADLYKLAYSRSFNMDPKDVDKGQRQIGKVMELGLGFEGGVGAFLTFAAVYGLDLDALADSALPQIPQDVIAEALKAWEWAEKQNRTYGLTRRVYVACDSLKRLWRRAHPETVKFWKAVAEATADAIRNPGETFPCYRLKMRRDGMWLRIALPSGRVLCYPSPQVDEKGKISYMGVNQYTRKWQRLNTYSGKLVENIVQASARDVIADTMPVAEEAGYQVLLTVHDEDITEAPDLPEFNEHGLAAIMSGNPAWADGLPLAAAGFEGYRYRKD